MTRVSPGRRIEIPIHLTFDTLSTSKVNNREGLSLERELPYIFPSSVYSENPPTAVSRPPSGVPDWFSPLFSVEKTKSP